MSSHAGWSVAGHLASKSLAFDIRSTAWFIFSVMLFHNSTKQVSKQNRPIVSTGLASAVILLEESGSKIGQLAKDSVRFICEA